MIQDAAYAADVPHYLFCVLFLDEPFDLAREGHMAGMNRRLDTLWNAWPELERARYIGRDISVGSIDFQSNHDVVGDRAHAADAFDRALGGQLAGIAIDETGERHHAALGGDAD